MISHIDTQFYKALSRSRTNKEVFECVKYVTKNPTPPILHAFVSCLFISKLHRKAISRCIRNRLREKAIPALLDTINSLSSINKVKQLILLCKLGHKPSLPQMVGAITKIQDIPLEIQKSVSVFLTNYAVNFTNEFIRLIQSDSPVLILFAAPWCVKYEPKLACKQLLNISINSNVHETLRNQAFGLLSHYDPASALEVLAEGNVSFDINTALKAMECAYSSDDYEPEEGLLSNIFSNGRDDIKIAAAVLLSVEGHKQAIDLLRSWLIVKFKEIQTQTLDRNKYTFFSINKGAIALARINDKEFVSFLSSYDPPDNYKDGCQRIWFASKHPIGLAMLVKKLEEASDVDKMFSPMVSALKTYGVGAQMILHYVLAKGDERLKKRAAELSASIWPGRSLEELVNQYENSKKEKVAEKTVSKRPDRRERVSLLLERDPTIPKTLKELEDYTCQVCGRRLLNMKNGEPYAEIHHIHPLGHDGTDSIDNVLCLCPLCHRLFHLGAIGIDSELRLYLALGCKEHLLSSLRICKSRKVSDDALRYHWISFFAVPQGIRFCKDEDDEEDDAIDPNSPIED